MNSQKNDTTITVHIPGRWMTDDTGHWVEMAENASKDPQYATPEYRAELAIYANKLLDDGKEVRRGKGWSWVVELTPTQLSRLIEDFDLSIDTLEWKTYMWEDSDGTYYWSLRSYRTAVDRFRKQLTAAVGDEWSPHKREVAA